MGKKIKILAVVVLGIILIGGFVGLEKNKVRVTVENKTLVNDITFFITDENGKKIMNIPNVGVGGKQTVKVPKGIETDRIWLVFKSDVEKADEINGSLGIDWPTKKHTTLIINPANEDGIYEYEVK